MLNPIIARFILLGVLCLSGALSVAAAWPGVQFSEVRAYAYNRHEDNNAIIENGRLNRTVVNKRGVMLTSAQTTALIAAVTGKRPRPEFAVACFNPHHAFVFYDAAHQPTAWVEVCFECNDAATEPPPQKGQVYDLAVLYKLATELKIPLLPR